MSSQELLAAASAILDSLSDGVYVCDRDRRIVFWSCVRTMSESQKNE